MSSLISNFEYDIFISYRHNDNRSGWVTEFVNAFQQELAATIKYPVSVYFDTNPHDGLLETHNVDKSLEAKLKCLIIIPIISQTYCDTKSFAWQQELCAFNRLAKGDQFGRDIRLSSGNVTSRILPIKIHDLDAEDKVILENELGGALRAIEFIYKEAGVNRPLLPSDVKNENQNKTDYRNQVNKTANAVKELLTGLRNFGDPATSYSYDESSKETNPPDPASIAVLPFINMSNDLDQEYFSDGLTEEIIADLSKVKNLLVISRSSIMTLKGTKKKIKDIASEVNVRYILEGSVRKSGNNLRITAQLIDAVDDSHVWADKYNGSIEDVFDLQEKISQTIVSALKLKLSPEEERRFTERPITNINAYVCYLRARQEAYNFSEESLDRSLQLCQEALIFAGENELLYSMMGEVYLLLLLWGIKLDQSYLQKAEECAQKIYVLNPKSSQYHALRGMICYKQGNRYEAAKLLKLALDIAPENSAALIWLVSIYARSGSAHAMRPLLKRLLAIDPLTALVQAWVGWLAWLEGKTGAAVLEPHLRMYEMDPMNPYNRYIYALVLAMNGKIEESYFFLDLLAHDSPQHGFSRLGLFLKAALQGDRSQALQQATESLTSWAQTDDMASWWMADCFALIGENQKSLDWIENGMRQGLMNYPCLSKYDPLLENIRHEPRFATLIERVKQQWEAFES